MEPTLNTSIWFDKLSDGTIASTSDVLFHEYTITQPTYCTLSQTFNIQCATYAAHYIRQRFPELNRTEFGTLYKICRFDRVTQPEARAAKGVRLEHYEHKTEEELQKAVDTEVLEDINSHPTELGLLQWKISFHTTPKGDNTSLCMVFSASHNHVDAVSLQRLTEHFLSAYAKSLETPKAPLPVPEKLPLYSQLPQERVKISSWQSALSSTLSGLAVRAIKLQQPKCPYYKKDISKNDVRYHTVTYKVPAQNIKDLLKKCRSRKLTIGAAIHACLFYNTAKSYFESEGSSNKWSLNIGLSKNMRPHLDPPLPPTVITPQQGSVEVRFNSERGDIESLEGEEKNEKIWEWATLSRKKILDAKPMDSISGNVILGYIVRNNHKNMVDIEYIGDLWFSNVGLLTPPPELSDAGITIASTYTAMRPITPAYDIVWSNTVKGSDMILSMGIDTEVRNLEAAQAFLEDVGKTIVTL